jgi:bifunctional DNA-binding transcriptional regulator/antitoxin component of YhaV-PrlF toxin-antitoxin module
MAKRSALAEIAVERDGRIVIPAELTRRCGLKAGTKVLVQAEIGGFIVMDARRKRLLEAFIHDTKASLGNLSDDAEVFDGLTLQQFLALSEEELEARWNQAYIEACDELEHTKEIEVGADYVPAGQRRRAKTV